MRCLKLGHYHDRLVPLVVGMLEQGLSVYRISKDLAVSVTFVLGVVERYDWLYASGVV